jgi:hypothetical protein
MTTPLNSVRFLLIVLLLLPWAAASRGQSAPALSTAQSQALEQQALATEVRTAQDASHPMRYRLHRSTPRLRSTKEIIETRDGDVARLLTIDGQPLTQTADQKEQARLDALLNDPGQQQHRRKAEEEDSGIVLKLLRMLPHAFLYEYTGSSDGVEKFRFRPNPNFVPPDLETQALTAMTGEIWINASEKRVTRLEGHLQQDTNYAWGILGKLDKGGWVVIEQANVGGGQWRIVHVQMKMDLRILFKTKNIDTTEEMSGYAPVPAGIDYRQAIQMLRAGR